MLRNRPHSASRTLAGFLPLVGVAAIFAATPALAGSELAPVNLIVNGSFESPGAGCVAGATTVPGWSVSSGNVDIISAACSGMNAANGTYFLDLTGSYAGSGVDDVGTISQAVATVAGQRYTLNFRFGGNPQWQNFPYPNDSSLKAMAVFVNGAIAGVYSVTTQGVASSDPQWKERRITFTATSTATEIRFESLNGSTSNPSDFGPLLDNVTVAVVEHRDTEEQD